jgi:radical SAM superfamily enzyme YgiQ (UPF0313 family)
MLFEMKILLIRPAYNFDGYSPTALAILSAVAEDLGHKVRIVDLNMEDFPCEEKFDVCGITGMSTWKESIISILSLIKTFGTTHTVIVGGSWASLYPEEVLSHKGVKYVCLDEGEKVWKEFLQKYPHVKGIEGLGYRENGNEIVLNQQKTHITDLNSYPLPAWHLVKNLNKYSSVSLYTSRGCIFDCCFCSNRSQWGHQWRARSPESVVNEIEILTKKFKVKNIVFNDENMTLDPKRVEAICQGVIDKNIKVSLNCVQGVRVDKLPFELLDLMKKAGFRQISFSPESGCERVLKEVIHKNLDLKFVEPVVKHATEIGLHTMAKFVVGFPWETKAEVEETLRFAEKLRSLGCESYVGNVIPFPDTELYAKAKAEGYLRFSDAEIAKVASDTRQPRKIHCLTSPYWMPEWIIEVCAEQYKKDMQAVLKRTPKTRLIKHAVKHPIMMLKKLRKAI